jgi:hypothetical protein
MSAALVTFSGGLIFESWDTGFNQGGRKLIEAGYMGVEEGEQRRIVLKSGGR